MGTETLEVEEELFRRVNQFRMELGYSWERAFALMKSILKADLDAGHGDDGVPPDSEAGEALVRRVEGGGQPSNIVVIGREDLDQKVSGARECGYEEGYEEGLSVVPQEKRKAIKARAVEGALVELGVCRRCRDQDADSIHHLIPRSEGGADTVRNKIPLCDDCHDRVEILTEKFLAERDSGPDQLRDYIENGFPIWVYE